VAALVDELHLLVGVLGFPDPTGQGLVAVVADVAAAAVEGQDRFPLKAGGAHRFGVCLVIAPIVSALARGLELAPP
jgi:hypothetical protein